MQQTNFGSHQARVEGGENVNISFFLFLKNIECYCNVMCIFYIYSLLFFCFISQYHHLRKATYLILWNVFKDYKARLKYWKFVASNDRVSKKDTWNEMKIQKERKKNIDLQEWDEHDWIGGECRGVERDTIIEHHSKWKQKKMINTGNWGNGTVGGIQLQ